MYDCLYELMSLKLLHDCGIYISMSGVYLFSLYSKAKIFFHVHVGLLHNLKWQTCIQNWIQTYTLFKQ